MRQHLRRRCCPTQQKLWRRKHGSDLKRCAGNVLVDADAFGPTLLVNDESIKTSGTPLVVVAKSKVSADGCIGPLWSSRVVEPCHGYQSPMAQGRRPNKEGTDRCWALGTSRRSCSADAVAEETLAGGLVMRLPWTHLHFGKALTN